MIFAYQVLFGQHGEVWLPALDVLFPSLMSWTVWGPAERSWKQVATSNSCPGWEVTWDIWNWAFNEPSWWLGEEGCEEKPGCTLSQIAFGLMSHECTVNQTFVSWCALLCGCVLGTPVEWYEGISYLYFDMEKLSKRIRPNNLAFIHSLVFSHSMNLREVFGYLVGTSIFCSLSNQRQQKEQLAFEFVRKIHPRP